MSSHRELRHELDKLTRCTAVSEIDNLVPDADSGQPINDASVQIIANEAPEEETDFVGDYKTGYAVSGTYNVTFSTNSCSGFSAKDIPGAIALVNMGVWELKYFLFFG